MSYVHETISGIDIIELNDDIDLYTVPEVKKFCKELIIKGSKKIILCLEKPKFIDSAGLGMLANLHFESSEKKINLKLAALSFECKKILESTKMINNFEIYKTINEAVLSFG